MSIAPFNSTLIVLPLCIYCRLIALVENYPLGYPRLAAFQSSDDDFIMFRRFATIHVRCLLLAQDKICSLEERLRYLDDTERTQLFLSSREHDENSERHTLLQELKIELREYGVLIRL
jgi:hypothetical protein